MAGIGPGGRPAGQRLPTVAGYLALLRSGLILIVVTTVIGALIGFALARRVPPAFQARSAVELPDVPTWVDTDPEGAVPERTTIDSTAQLVYSRPVVTSVAAATQLDRKEVLDNLSVSAYPLSRVLVITFEAGVRDTALVGADAAAEALIRVRANVLPGSRMQAARELSRELNGLIGEADRKVGPYNPISRQIRQQVAQITQVRQAASGDRGRIVESADAAKVIDNHGELQVTTGAALGFLVGLGYAWWRPRQRRRFSPPWPLRTAIVEQ